MAGGGQTPHLLLVAQVAGAFGVKGEVRLTAFTANPMALLGYSPLLGEAGAPALNLQSGRADKASLIVRAKEADTREQALALRGLRLFIDRARLPPLEDDEYYLADLIGVAAVSPEGEPLGLVRSVHNFGAGDLLEIGPETGAPSWWAPFTKATVPEVRMAEGVIVVAPPVETEG